MLNLEYLDSKYRLYEITNETIYIGRGRSKEKKFSLIEILKRIEKGDKKFKNKGFSTYYSSANVQDYIVVRQLNDYIKVMHWDTYAMTFGHLDALITKTPITVPEGLKKKGDEIDEIVKFTNQVFYLEPFDENDEKLKEGIESRRRDVADMLVGMRIGEADILSLLDDLK